MNLSSTMCYSNNMMLNRYLEYTLTFLNIVMPFQVGLELLWLLCQNLNNVLTLQTLYDLQSTLLKQNLDLHINEAGHIIDANSILRNKLLLFTLIIGGPNE